MSQRKTIRIALLLSAIFLIGACDSTMTATPGSTQPLSQVDTNDELTSENTGDIREDQQPNIMDEDSGAPIIVDNTPPPVNDPTDQIGNRKLVGLGNENPLQQAGEEFWNASTLISTTALGYRVLKDPGYAMDSTQVFFRNRVLAGADPAEFVLLGDGFSKTNSQVFFFDREIEGADASSFMALGEDYAKDDQFYYYKRTRLTRRELNLTGDSSASGIEGELVVIGNGFARDDVKVLGRRDVLRFSDVGTRTSGPVPASGFTYEHGLIRYGNQVFYSNGARFTLSPLASLQFLPITDNCHTINDKVHCHGRMIPDADRESFEVINRHFVKDSVNVYQITDTDRLSPIPALFPANGFEILNKHYVKTNSQVFFLGIASVVYDYSDGVDLEVVEGADPNTFSVIGNTFYGKDANKGYFESRPITDHPNALRPGFEPRIAISLEGLFYRGQLVKPVSQLPSYMDLSSFRFLSRWIAVDDNHVYRMSVFGASIGIRYAGLNNNVQALGGQYFTDGTTVFYGSSAAEPPPGGGSWTGPRPIEGADPETFQTLNYDLAKDKDRVYTFVTALNLNPNQLILYGAYSRFVSDGSLVYNGSNLLNVQDLASFRPVSIGTYWLDSQGLHFNDDLIEQNPEGIVSQQDRNYYYRYIKTNRAIYYLGDKIEGLDIATAEVINDGFARDKDNLYVGLRIIPNLDPARASSAGNISIRYREDDGSRTYYSTNDFRDLE